MSNRRKIRLDVQDGRVTDLSRDVQRLTAELASLQSYTRSLVESLSVHFANGQFAVYAGDNRISEWSDVPEDTDD